MIGPNESSLDMSRISKAVSALDQFMDKSNPVNAILENLNLQPSKLITNSYDAKLAAALQTSERQLAMNLTADINNVSEESETRVKPE